MVMAVSPRPIHNQDYSALLAVRNYVFNTIHNNLSYLEAISSVNYIYKKYTNTSFIFQTTLGGKITSKNLYISVAFSMSSWQFFLAMNL